MEGGSADGEEAAKHILQISRELVCRIMACSTPAWIPSNASFVHGADEPASIIGAGSNVACHASHPK